MFTTLTLKRECEKNVSVKDVQVGNFVLFGKSVFEVTSAQKVINKVTGPCVNITGKTLTDSK